MISIAAGGGHDIAEIMPVMHSAFDPHYGEAWSAAQCIAALSMPGCGLIIARREKRAAGFAITRWVLDQEELLMIGISPAEQRQGTGKLMIDYVINKSQKSGRNMLFLEVRDGNSAYFFYRKMGFTESGRRKNYYRGLSGDYHDAITMTRHF